MKIGIVTTWQERGAAYVSRQYRDALSKDHEVFIYARGGEKYAIGNIDWDGPAVTWGRKVPIHTPLAVDREDFQHWIKDNKLEIIFFNEQQWWDPVLWCQDLGVKTGAYVDYYTKETVPFFGLYDFLICNTRRHHSVFSWHPQAVYIPWGTDPQLFHPRSSAPVQPGSVTFFHSAGLSPERKGTDIAIRAFAKLEGPARLIIHSQTDIAKAYPELSGTIQALLKDKRLEFDQRTVGAPGLYHLGDVYVYPSRLDGIGLTLAEALAVGLPVITSDNPPMNEFIDGTNGRLVKTVVGPGRSDGYYWPLCEADVDSLAEKMQTYIKDIDHLSEAKEAARRSAEKNFDWRKNSRDLGRVFSECKTRSRAEKTALITAIISYEARRSNWRTKAYRRFPWLFKPVAWLWPLIRRRYIEKV